MKIFNQRNRSILITFAALSVNLFFFAGAFLSLSMSPSDKSVTLRYIDGFTFNPLIGSLFMVAFTSIASLIYVRNNAQRIALIIGLLSVSSVAVSTIVLLLSRNFAALNNQIESATGIAATHGIKNVEILIEPGAWSAIFVSFASMFLLLMLVINQKHWKLPTARIDVKAQNEDKRDLIGVWDSQR